ncbi:hypothetical protein RCO48_25655 [Peribacillus frigoritolerans]|nr:hypothetical protein [Peribacillus frigoritolerans]
MSYVTIEQVTKGYDNQLVLNNISLTLKKGEFATLLGQSRVRKKVHYYVPLRDLKTLM